MRNRREDRAAHRDQEKRTPYPPEIAALPPGGLVRASGIPVSVEIEHAVEAERIDHVWLDIDCGSVGIVRCAVNTWSRRNAAAGFEPRVRVGLVREKWEILPELAIEAAAGLDYSAIESRANVFYETLEKRDIELLVIEKTDNAVRVEVWGQLYMRETFGIHQIHSRRASCAVAEDLVGQDGAVKFYFDNAHGRTSEMLLLKFCGQE